MSIKDLQRDWEDMAELDPLWAIISVPEKQYKKWDIEEFFKTGEIEIERLFTIINKLGNPKNYHRALDFGCGVGRLTRALSKKFEESIGVDISSKMISLANEMNSSYVNCKFQLNENSNLKIFENDYFDLIYSIIVLQHISDPEITKSYISEFVRILNKDGLLVFQIPSYIPPSMRIQTGAMEFSNLRRGGEDSKFLYEKRKLNPIRMNFLPEAEVIRILMKQKAKILEIKNDGMAGSEIESRTYYITK
ncbi:MAG: class I SAM-dependent methyltransferase [Nitrosopumilus sp.]|nr:class I SAM-dependent methyltransferase [Nitrosopumilus sp.]